MNIFSSPKRMLNLNRTRAPKMSSRRQFHRALRRHPAWPMVMAEAAARARAQESIRRNSTSAMEMGTVSHRKRFRRIFNRNRINVMTVGQASGRSQLRRNIRRNRVLLVTLVAVGGLVAVLNGVSLGSGGWFPRVGPFAPPASPTARYLHASAYDLKTKDVVIFGGKLSASGTIFNDTWTWNGDNWRDQKPSTKPPGRFGHSMVYDAARGVTVMFGGKTSHIGAAGFFSDETWSWDGTIWTKLNPPASPSPRFNASMTYDAHRRVVVLFGGQSPAGTAGLNDTWTWNGQTWTQLHPVDSPTPKSGAAVAFDGCRGETVLFGGLGGAPTPGSTQGSEETWTWNGVNWTKHNPFPSPPPINGGRMTYEASQGRAVLFGGFLTSSQLASFEHEVWKWDGAARTWERDITWDTADPVAIGLLAVRVAPPRGYHIFEYDVERGFSLLFGGVTSTAPLADGVALGDTWRHQPDATFLTKPVLGRKCTNPIAPPAYLDDPVGGHPEAPKVESGQFPTDLKEIGRLAVFTPPGRDDVLPPGSPPQPCRRLRGFWGGKSVDLTDEMMLFNAERRRAYQFFAMGCPPNQSTGGLHIQTIDLDTLKPLKAVQVSGLPNPGIGGLSRGKGQWPHVWDKEAGLIYLRVGDALWALAEDKIEKGEPPIVGQITLPGIKGVFSTLQTDPAGGIQKLITQEPTGDNPPPTSFALYKHPKTGRKKLLLHYGLVASSPNTGPPVVIAQMDLQTQSIEWTKNLSSECTAGAASVPSVPMFRTGSTVYTICSARTAVAGVVSIPITEDAQGKEVPGQVSVSPGPTYVARAWGDPSRERMLLMTEIHLGYTLWTFDGKASRYVGRSGFSLAQLKVGYGFDQEAGRFYALVSDGSAGNNHTRPPIQGALKVLDIGATPVPQPVGFPQLSYFGELDIRVDPAADGRLRRVFLRRAAGSAPSPGATAEESKATDDQVRRYPDGQIITLPDEPEYMVLEDRLPFAEPLSIAQLDAFTLPVKEREGATEPNYDAVGSAYGLRFKSVGGISSIYRPPPQTPQAQLVDQTESNNVFDAGLAPSCLYPDREFLAGWVEEAHLSDLEASARGAGLEADSSSKVDLEGPFQRCAPPAPFSSQGAGAAKDALNTIYGMLPFTQADNEVGKHVKWGDHFQRVECVGEQEKTFKATAADVSGKADCRQKERVVEAEARGSLGSSDAEFSVGESTSSVVVRRDPVRGVVVTSTAIARGFNIAGFTIDMVKTVSEVWSNGKTSGQPRATFTRWICGVKSPAFTKDECLTPQQQKDMIVEMNKRLGINGRVSLPEPDSEYFKGSPGGYIAGVTKPIADEIDAQIFNRDFQKEVPGLEVIFYKDSFFFGPGRQILQLAAVRAVAGYGVQCLSDLIFSPAAKDCVAFAAGEEAFDLGDDFSGSDVVSEEGAFNLGLGGEEPAWTPAAPAPRASGVGRFLDQIPVVRLLPIRQMGEALLSASVWLLFLLPALLASRRFALNLAKRS